MPHRNDGALNLVCPGPDVFADLEFDRLWRDSNEIDVNSRLIDDVFPKRERGRIERGIWNQYAVFRFLSASGADRTRWIPSKAPLPGPFVGKRCAESSC